MQYEGSPLKSVENVQSSEQWSSTWLPVNETGGALGSKLSRSWKAGRASSLLILYSASDSRHCEKVPPLQKKTHAYTEHDKRGIYNHVGQKPGDLLGIQLAHLMIRGLGCVMLVKWEYLHSLLPSIMPTLDSLRDKRKSSQELFFSGSWILQERFGPLEDIFWRKSNSYGVSACEIC